MPDRNNPNLSYPYRNQAFVAVDTGFEIQIDEEARGDTRFNEPDGFFYNRTGAIYKVTGLGANPGQQDYPNTQKLAPHAWHGLEIEVNGQVYAARLNGQPATRFTNTDGFRGRPPSLDEASGYVGVQCHTGLVAFRRIQLRKLPSSAPSTGGTPSGRPRRPTRRFSASPSTSQMPSLPGSSSPPGLSLLVSAPRSARGDRPSLSTPQASHPSAARASRE